MLIYHYANHNIYTNRHNNNKQFGAGGTKATHMGYHSHGRRHKATLQPTNNRNNRNNSNNNKTGRESFDSQNNNDNSNKHQHDKNNNGTQQIPDSEIRGGRDEPTLQVY